MKKLLIALTGMLLGSGAYAQTIVDTTVQKRNVVVEEFTGVDCGYCPHGHQLVNELANSYPGRVVPINIHCGVYSSNTYTTPYGETLLSNTAYAGFPCGAINRKLSGCAVDAMNRSYFKSTGKSVLNQDSPVNIAATAKVNAETREMSIHIEVYYTKDVNQAYNLLNVALLQDKIIGKQSNYNQNNSEYITEDGQYMHMHMLRDLITGQWGAQIMSNEDSVIKAGSFLDTTIVYTIPKIISNEYVKFGNINLALFITDGYNLNCKNVKGPNIYTGISCTPEYTNLESLVDVVTDKIYITPQYGKGCNDLVNADILLTNNAGDVTSLTVEYGSLLTKDTYTYTYEDTLKALQSSTVSLPNAIKVIPGQTDSIFVNVISANGKEINNVAKIQTIKKNLPSEGYGIPTLIVVTDKYGGEISWNILNENGEIIKSGGNYNNNVVTYDTVLIDAISTKGCYAFEINDKGGNGANGGLYKLIDATGKSLAVNAKGNWGAGEIKDFKIMADAGINELSENIFQSVLYPNPAKDNVVLNVHSVYPTDVTINIYDVMGRIIYIKNAVKLSAGENNININTSKFENGIYSIKIIANNGIITNKFSITK